MGERGSGLQNRCRRLERLSSGCQVVFGVDNMSRHLLLGFYGYCITTTTTCVGDGETSRLVRLLRDRDSKILNGYFVEVISLQLVK